MEKMEWIESRKVETYNITITNFFHIFPRFFLTEKTVKCVCVCVDKEKSKRIRERVKEQRV